MDVDGCSKSRESLSPGNVLAVQTYQFENASYHTTPHNLVQHGVEWGPTLHRELYTKSALIRLNYDIQDPQGSPMV